MRKRRDLIENINFLFKSNVVKITKEQNQELFFEIKNEITSDVAEAVSIMLILNLKSKDIWDIEINKNLNIDTSKCLYWLSGGNKEWIMLDNYKGTWVDYHSIFQGEFDLIINDIINNAKNLGEIRNGFIKHLNLPIIYEFAIANNLIR